MNELEGLSKVCKPGPSVTHAAHVKEAARAALHLLHERQPALKPVTTKGHVLNSTAFILEEDTAPVPCLNYLIGFIIFFFFVRIYSIYFIFF